MPTVFANNITMHYIEAGQGPPLFLLHGLGSSHEMWLPIVSELSRSYRVIAADTRGHGASDKPQGQYSIRLFADDWLALMDALGVERAHLLGLSMGGAIAMRLAADAPQRVRSLILVDTWAFPHPDFLAMLRQRLEKLGGGALGGYAEVAIPQVFSPGFIQANPQAIADFRARIARAGPDSLRSAIQACMSHDMRGTLARIQTPTLVLVGSEDRLLPPFHSEYLRRAISKAALTVIGGSGHIPHLEAPARFLKAVREFLAASDQENP